MLPARKIYRSSQYDHVMSLLKELRWLRVPERIEFKLCSLVYKCLNGSGPAAYVTDSLQRLTDGESLGRLRSSSSTLAVPVTCRATPGDGRPDMERSTRLRHISANRLFILHCDEGLSVLQNFLPRDAL